MTKQYDLLVVGGGINGCGVARDAAGRGLSVLLAERGDLACGTSSASTRLVHGGLRYLQQYQFGLVRRSLRERRILQTAAPHLVRPMRFVMPLSEDAPSALMLRMGLLLYDQLGGRRAMPASKAVDLSSDAAGAPLRSGMKRAFSYWDCQTSDSRLVVLVAMDAAARGANILSRAELLEGAQNDGRWQARLLVDGSEREVSVRAIVNAAGVWAPEVMRRLGQTPAKLRYVSGSHIVLPKLYGHDSAYLLPQPDGRVVFAIPSEDKYTLVGTTERELDSAPAHNSVPDSDEVEYLLRAIDRYFPQGRSTGPPVSAYCGVRAIADMDGGSATRASRDHRLQRSPDGPPLVSVLGGKLTTHRPLAEDVVDGLSDVFPGLRAAWTAGARLPGGDLPSGGVDALAETLRQDCPYLAPEAASRLAGSYGSLALDIVARPPGEHFGSGLYENEVEYMVSREWAREADDVLWRRSQIGLQLDAVGRERLESWLQKRLAAREETRT